METPPPNYSLKASLSPPIGGRLRSFRRDWQTNKCSSNVLNIITNGYILPFLSKPSLFRFPLIQSEYKARQKDQALATCIQSLLSKNTIERVENVKSLGFYSCLFLVPKPNQRWRPVPKQAQHFSTHRKVQNGNSRVHQDLPDSRGMGIVDRPISGLPSHPHPPKLKDIPKVYHRLQVFQFTFLPFGLATAPQVFTMIVKEVKLMALSRGLRLHQYLDDWRQNPANMMKGADLHPKDHSIQLFTDVSNEGWGAHLDESSTKGLWSDREKATHKHSRVEGGLPSPSKLQGPVPEPNSASYNGQLNSGSLHKQTRRNSLSRDVRSPVEDHDMVPSPSHNIKSQTHSRVSEYDGRPSVQVKPSSVNRMVTASAGVQTDLSKVVHSSCRSICHSSEPQTSTLCISCPGSKCLGHRCSELKLDGSHSLCLPSDGSPSQGDPKNQLHDHCNSPSLARDALVLEPSAALNRDPSTTPNVNNSSQTVPQLSVPQQSTTSQPPLLVSRSGQLQEQGFSVEVAERISAPQRSSTRTI